MGCRGMIAAIIIWIIFGIVAAVWLVSTDTDWRDTPGYALVIGLTAWPFLLLVVVVGFVFHKLGKGILLLAGFVDSFRKKKD